MRVFVDPFGEIIDLNKLVSEADFIVSGSDATISEAIIAVAPQSIVDILKASPWYAGWLSCEKYVASIEFLEEVLGTQIKEASTETYYEWREITPEGLMALPKPFGPACDEVYLNSGKFLTREAAERRLLEIYTEYPASRYKEYSLVELYRLKLV